jgi:hypothetical protein
VRVTKSPSMNGRAPVVGNTASICSSAPVSARPSGAMSTRAPEMLPSASMVPVENRVDSTTSSWNKSPLIVRAAISRYVTVDSARSAPVTRTDSNAVASDGSDRSPFTSTATRRLYNAWSTVAPFTARTPGPVRTPTYDASSGSKSSSSDTCTSMCSTAKFVRYPVSFAPSVTTAAVPARATTAGAAGFVGTSSTGCRFDLVVGFATSATPPCTDCVAPINADRPAAV